VALAERNRPEPSPLVGALLGNGQPSLEFSSGARVFLARRRA